MNASIIIDNYSTRKEEACNCVIINERDRHYSCAENIIIIIIKILLLDEHRCFIEQNRKLKLCMCARPYAQIYWKQKY